MNKKQQEIKKQIDLNEKMIGLFGEVASALERLDKRIKELEKVNEGWKYGVGVNDFDQEELFKIKEGEKLIFKPQFKNFSEKSRKEINRVLGYFQTDEEIEDEKIRWDNFTNYRE